jgi:ketosteroid isomerase-like protein
MRRFCLLSAVALLCLPVAGWSQRPTAPQLQSVTLPPELDRVLRDYETAWRAGDATALSQLFADGRVVMTNSGRAVMGRDMVRQFYSGGGGGLNLRAMAYAKDDTVAYIIGAYRVREGNDDTGTFVLTLVRPSANGKWLITADMDRAHRQ